MSEIPGKPPEILPHEALILNLFAEAMINNPSSGIILDDKSPMRGSQGDSTVRDLGKSATESSRVYGSKPKSH